MFQWLFLLPACQHPAASALPLESPAVVEAQSATAKPSPEPPLPLDPRTDHPEHYDLLEIDGDRIVLPGAVEFVVGKDTLQPSARAVLDVVADFLLARPDLGRIEIQAHLSADQAPKYGRRPSQHRADAVRHYLVDRGVDPARLEARGYGESMPIDTNATAEGRAHNRRVELRILADAADDETD